MAIQEISVNMTDLGSCVSTLEEKVQGLRNEMQKIFQEITELDAMWDGPANTEFNTQFQADREAMDNLLKTFDTIVGNYDFANKEYIKCEDEVHNIVSSIAI